MGIANSNVGPEPEGEDVLISIDSGSDEHTCPAWMPGVDLVNGPETRLRDAQGEIIESGGVRRVRFMLWDTCGEPVKAYADFVISD
eukprot:2952966-Alexandrium_andersonii.AAC.1